jgi:hypothetical protein
MDYIILNTIWLIAKDASLRNTKLGVCTYSLKILARFFRSNYVENCSVQTYTKCIMVMV